MMKNIYKTLVSRNWYFIQPNIQRKIEQTKICFAGCGLGSNIAILATRTGFNKFTLCDGDKVELSNLNRQHFFINDVGKNKAITLSKYIKKINPETKLQILPQFISRKNIPQIIKSDILINTINFSKDYFEITKAFLKKNKPVLLPLNVGFGSVVVVFKKINNIYEMMELSVKNDIQMYEFLLKNIKNLHIPKQYSTSRLLPKIIKKGYDPQLGVASSLSASFTLSVLTKILGKANIKNFPQAYHFDLMRA